MLRVHDLFVLDLFCSHKNDTAVSTNLFPYPNLTLKTNFSKTCRQKLKVKLYCDRARLTL